MSDNIITYSVMYGLRTCACPSPCTFLYCYNYCEGYMNGSMSTCYVHVNFTHSSIQGLYGVCTCTFYTLIYTGFVWSIVYLAQSQVVNIQKEIH